MPSDPTPTPSPSTVPAPGSAPEPVPADVPAPRTTSARTGLPTSTLALLGLGLLALLVIVGASFWVLERTNYYAESLVHSRMVRTNAERLLAQMQDAETGQRGFLLTLDPAYLAPYEATRRNLPPVVARLHELLRDEPAQDARITALQPVIDGKLAELAETIRLAQAGKPAEALALVRSDQGKIQMDRFRTGLDAFTAEVDKDRLARLGEQRDGVQMLRWVTVGSAVVILAVVGGAIAVLLRASRALVRSSQEIETLNTDLEGRVADRTLDLTRANDEIQRFAYIVSHDLRSPLVNIMGFTAELDASLQAARRYIEADPSEPGHASRLADAKLAVQEDVPEALGFIRASTTRMDGLINAILRLSREGRRTLVSEPVDLGTVVETAAASVRHRLDEAGGAVDLKLPLPRVTGDKVALDQIFGNLLDNAVKYRSPERPPRITVRGSQRQGQALIEVSDNGRGIAAGDHERVFELFRRSGVQDQPGEGIGLAHVRALVRRLGGEITLSSAIGQGSTFTVSLPMAVAPRGARATGRKSAPGAISTKAAGRGGAPTKVEGRTGGLA